MIDNRIQSASSVEFFYSKNKDTWYAIPLRNGSSLFRDIQSHLTDIETSHTMDLTLRDIFIKYKKSRFVFLYRNPILRYASACTFLQYKSIEIYKLYEEEQVKWDEITKENIGKAHEELGADPDGLFHNFSFHDPHFIPTVFTQLFYSTLVDNYQFVHIDDYSDFLLEEFNTRLEDGISATGEPILKLIEKRKENKEYFSKKLYKNFVTFLQTPNEKFRLNTKPLENPGCTLNDYLYPDIVMHKYLNKYKGVNRQHNIEHIARMLRMYPYTFWRSAVHAVKLIEFYDIVDERIKDALDSAYSNLEKCILDHSINTDLYKVLSKEKGL